MLNSLFISINVWLQIAIEQLSNESTFLLEYFRYSCKELVFELDSQVSVANLVETSETHAVVGVLPVKLGVKILGPHSLFLFNAR